MSIVVKIGGEVIGSGEAKSLAGDLKILIDEGAMVAIVHGGGPQATALQKQLGLETKQVAGRRVTDAATLDVMKMAVAGKLNRQDEFPFLQIAVLLGETNGQSFDSRFPIGVQRASVPALAALGRLLGYRVESVDAPLRT